MSLGDRLRDSIIGVASVVAVSTATVTFMFTEFISNREIEALKTENKNLENKIKSLKEAETAHIDKLQYELAVAKEKLAKSSSPVKKVQHYPPADDPECRIVNNVLAFSRFTVGTKCPAISNNAVIRADKNTRKVGLTVAETSQPATVFFEGFDPSPVKTVRLELKFSYLREQTITLLDGGNRIALIIITPHNLFFDGKKHNISDAKFFARQTNELMIILSEGEVQLFVNGTWIDGTKTTASGIDRVIVNGLVEHDYLYTLAGTA